MAKLIYHTPSGSELAVDEDGTHIPLHALFSGQNVVLKGLYYIQAVADGDDVSYLHNYDSVGAGRDPVAPVALPGIAFNKIPGDQSVTFTSETIEGAILKQYIDRGSTVGGPFVWTATGETADLHWGLYRFDPMQVRR